MTEAARIIEALRSEIAAGHPDILGREETMILLERYVEELCVWGRRMHLTGRSSLRRTIPHQIADSLIMLECAEEALREQGGRRKAQVEVLDIGAGAGFPGLVWKIVRPAWSMALVERKEKSAAFLRRTAALLGLIDLQVLEGDAREIARAGRDMIVSKAAGTFLRMLPLVRVFARPGGLYITAKGAAWRLELERAQAQDFSVVAMRPIAPDRGVAIALRFSPPQGARFT